jgi:Ca2+/H+ antiporter, TMEM165/GDT1 family
VDLAVVATVFGVIFAAELPDKTMVATLVLSTRFPPLLVWVGVAGAFLVQVAIAVAAGRLLSLAPARAVAAASGALFAVGAGVLLLGRPDEADVSTADAAPPGARRAVKTSFAVLFVSEWGDLSQLATAGFAARFADPVSVFTGAFAALATVAALAVVVGRSLLRLVPVAVVRRIAGAALAVLSMLALAQAVRGG